VSFLM